MKTHTPAGEARAERFEIADAAGKPRAWLATGADGAPQIAVADAEGRPRAVLSVGAKGSPSVELRDETGAARAVVSLEAEGASVTLRTPSGKESLALRAGPDGAATVGLGGGKQPRTMLAADSTGEGALTFAGADGAPRASVAPSKDGYALEIRDDEGMRRTEVRSNRISASEVRVCDKDGKVRGRIGMDKERGATVSLTSVEGQDRAVLGERGSLALSDPDGHVRCTVEATAEMGGAVRLMDAAAVNRAVLECGPDGLPSLELRDAAGTEVAQLGARENGTPSLTMTDAATKQIRAWLDLGVDEGARLGFYAKDGKRRLSVGIDENTIPYCQLLDAEEHIRACLYAQDGGDCALDFRTSENKSILSLYATPELRPGLSMCDTKLVERLWFGVNTGNDAVMSMMDSDAKVRVQSAVRDDKSNYVGLRDGAGAFRAYLSASETGSPGFYLYDSAAKVRASFYLSTTEDPNFRFDDKSGNERLWISSLNEKGSMISLYDSSKRLRASFYTVDDGTPSFTLHDTTRERLSFGLTSTQLPVAHFTDSSGKDRLQFGLLDNETGRYNITDGNGGVIWAAP
ncbi:MAG: hypothetical protein K8T20_07550 [Planctomycetes bacterium]|nr:hypothetical protein [Planctomycetota bacterium]